MTDERAKDIIKAHYYDLKAKMPENTTVIEALKVAIASLDKSWDEFGCFCDNCGHYIHIKREDAKKKGK